jgi:NADH-quinone oxidoreductase subunit N
VAFSLVVVGYGFEMTLVPLHLWSPDTFDGATAPIAGFVSVVPKVAAFAALLRFITVVMPPGGDGWNVALAVAAVITMTLGNVVALRQTTLKRLLAYSSIGQAGYILAATAVIRVAPDARDAVAFYLLVYAFMNLAAFGIVAAIERAHGGDGLEVLNGLGRTSPWAGAVLVIALLSLAGIPPLAGFAGKILLLQAMIGGGMTWLAIIAILNMVVGLYYYAMLAGRLYFEIPSSSASPSLDGCEAIAMVATTVGTLVLGVWPAFGLFP